MENETDEQKKIALAVLTEKHKNGGVEDVHKQVFFKLQKSNCPVCDIPASLWMQKQMVELEANTALSMLSADKIAGAHSKAYDPKEAVPPVPMKCKDCGKTTMVAYDAVYGPEYKRVVDKDNKFQCSSCWWETTGSKI